MSPRISIDQSGDYDRFLLELERKVGLAQPGMVRFVLDASTAKPASLPRWVDFKAAYGNLFVDEKSFDGLDSSSDLTHQFIAQLLKERISQTGYYLICDFNHQAYLVPAPKFQPINPLHDKYKPLGAAFAPALNFEPVDPIAYQPKPFFLPEAPASFEFSRFPQNRLRFRS